MLNVENILLISDCPIQQRVFSDFATLISKEKTVELIVIASHASVTEIYLQNVKPDILLLDISVCESSNIAYEFVELLQQWQKNLTIVFLLETEDEHEITKLLNRGVQDYLLTSCDNHELIRRTLRHALQRKRYEEKIAYLTKQDHLTGLMSGDLIQSSLRQAINSVKRDNSLVALYFIDIDHFKNINDEHGHAVGNALLIEIASRLKGILAEDCILARFSADMFVLIDIAEDIDACAVMAEEIISTLRGNITIGNALLKVSASIGVATYPECGADEIELLKNAEISLYEAKKQGRGGYRFFSQELNRQATWRIHITSALKEVMNDDSFSLHYQPKILLATGEVTGVEALIRWQHPIYGAVRPDQFIPLAEEAGLIANVTAWVAETACKQHQHPDFVGLNMAINISAKELCSDNVVGLFAYILNKYSMPPELMILEITETAMLTDSVKALANMHALKKLGLKLDIDDFGTGYSSIDYLRRYPVDALKIDRSFIMHMHQHRDDAKVVKLMVDIASELGLQVVAEGVEIAEQAEMLKAINCTQAQGYHFARPMPAIKFIEWLENYNKNHIDIKII